MSHANTQISFESLPPLFILRDCSGIPGASTTIFLPYASLNKSAFGLVFLFLLGSMLKECRSEKNPFRCVFVDEVVNIVLAELTKFCLEGNVSQRVKRFRWWIGSIRKLRKLVMIHWISDTWWRHKQLKKKFSIEFEMPLTHCLRNKLLIGWLSHQGWGVFRNGLRSHYQNIIGHVTCYYCIRKSTTAPWQRGCRDYIDPEEKNWEYKYFHMISIWMSYSVCDMRPSHLVLF